jgi:hypothetical protein
VHFAGKQTFTNLKAFEDAVEAQGLDTMNDASTPFVEAVDSDEAYYGQFKLEENGSEGEGTGVLFSTPEEFDSWCMFGDKS